MSLSTVLKEIETNRPNAEMDITMGSPQTYGGRVGLKRAAIEAVERLKLEYRNELMASTSFIIVTGSARNAFSELASSEKFECFSVDSEELYRDLVSSVDPQLFGRENAKGLFNIIDNVLRDKAVDLGIRSYPTLSFSDKYNSAVNNAEDLVSLVKTAINDQVGSEIVGLNSVYSIVDEAIKRNHSATVTPVILNTSDEKFALDLQKNLKRRRHSDGTYSGLTDKVFLVVSGKASKEVRATATVSVKEVSEETVGEALTTIRSKILL